MLMLSNKLQFMKFCLHEKQDESRALRTMPNNMNQDYYVLCVTRGPNAIAGLHLKESSQEALRVCEKFMGNGTLSSYMVHCGSNCLS